MLDLKSSIKFTQIPNESYPDRTNTFEFNFLNEFEMTSTWFNLSDTGKLIVPQKLSFRDKDGNLFSWNGKNISGQTNTSPILLRGDAISITIGYYFYDAVQQKRILVTDNVFNGYVSQVHSSTPLEIELMDNMYKLQQTAAPNKQWIGYTIETMVAELIKGTGFTLKTKVSGDNISNDIGDQYITENQTVAEVLLDLKKNYYVQSWFRGNELRCSVATYFPDDRTNHKFKFQYNIISDTLEYKRKDDVVVGVQVYSQKQSVENGVTKRGTTKYKIEKIKQFAVWNKGILNIYDEKPAGFQGEIRTLNFLAATKEQLKKLVKENINNVIYEGLEGTFTVFGLPFVKHGDSVTLIDDNMPDRNGTYIVNAIERYFGVGGYRQVITIGTRIDV